MTIKLDSSREADSFSHESGDVGVQAMLGVTIKEIERGDDYILFSMEDGTQYVMMHQQDCCETVYLEDVVGNLEDLIGSPIVQAEEATNDQDLPPDGEDEKSYTWTFYHLGTVKGSVTIRWFGSSNGYYSEEASVFLVKQ